jgi:hypothetical protein
MRSSTSEVVHSAPVMFNSQTNPMIERFGASFEKRLRR